MLTHEHWLLDELQVELGQLRERTVHLILRVGGAAADPTSRTKCSALDSEWNELGGCMERLQVLRLKLNLLGVLPAPPEGYALSIPVEHARWLHQRYTDLVAVAYVQPGLWERLDAAAAALAKTTEKNDGDR